MVRIDCSEFLQNLLLSKKNNRAHVDPLRADCAVFSYTKSPKEIPLFKSK